MDGDKQSNRSHRAPKSGNKADKKGTSKKLPDRGQNPKVRPPSSAAESSERKRAELLRFC